MPTVHLSPLGNDQAFYSHGTQLSGGKIFTYLSGTSTLAATYTDIDAGTANANPILLNAEGYPASGGARLQIWLIASTQYKFVLKDADDVILWTMDDIEGINDITLDAVEWVSTQGNAAPVRTSAQGLYLPGDHTADALVDRWMKGTHASTSVAYSIITGAIYDGGTNRTTMTVVNASGTLAADLAVLQWGLLKPDHTSVPLDATNLKAASMAGAASTLIWPVNGNLIHITAGVSPITSFGTAVKAGNRRRLIIDSAMILTHNASTLVCPGGVSLNLVANDVIDVVADTVGKAIVLPQGGYIPAGVIMDYGGSVVPAGWLECDGQSAVRTAYPALYAAITTTFGGGASPGTTFNVPDLRGRGRIGAGTGRAIESFTDAAVDNAADQITVVSNLDQWMTGCQVVYNVLSGSITNLTNGVTYYVIRTGNTTIKLATTLLEAQNGTFRAIGPATTGVFTITNALAARTTGQVGGDEMHAMNISELLAHTHTSDQWIAGGFGGGISTITFDTAVDSSSTGGNQAMNIMNPYVVTMAIIKY